MKVEEQRECKTGKQGKGEVRKEERKEKRKQKFFLSYEAAKGQKQRKEKPATHGKEIQERKA